MKVRCITISDPKYRADQYRFQQAFHVTVGREYLVLGLQFSNGSEVHRAGVWLHLVSDHGHLTWAPLDLFEIVSPRGSRYWVARVTDYGLTLWPESLYREYYHEDLAEGVLEIEADFRRVRELLELEDEGGVGA